LSATLAIPFLLLAPAALGNNLIQHLFVWLVETLAPKLSKILLATDLKRMCSTRPAPISPRASSSG
jgi:flagellar biosynthesis protein FlhB